MKTLVFALSLLFSASVFGAGALVQSKCSDSTVNPQASNISLTFDSGTGTTNTAIIACAGWDDSETMDAVDDASSNLTWAEDFEEKNASNESAGCWSANGTASVTQINFTFGGDISNAVVCIAEFSGVDYSTRSDVSTTVTDSTSHSSGNVTAETDGIMMGVWGGNTGDFSLVSSPWVELEAFGDACTTGCRTGIQYRLVPSGGSLSYTVTAGASNRDSGIGVIEIGPAAGGGGGGSTIVPHWVREMQVHQ